ncbi:glycosyltransferase family 39 protein [Stieleria sp. ICT_E10.1]|uniref:glycosyltransferase family 39 protein n=1 Tax=Stieleria sedimenti TaxID=2976331 RepID=UPI00217FDB65|nr:glycosyltransferase family 39 protein [Stieleria sedimenti]MCS7471129.1 glycosyltransferase family 39 protein [Stieleria sedimenti]
MNPRRRSLPVWASLAAPMLLFVVLRLPTLIHQPGVQDEQWFAVPGLTVWREGIPRIPYLPTRNRETLFENADVCLMALPPGLSYLQAPFFAIFPAGYATARIPLFLGALATIAIVFWIVKRIGGGDSAAGAAALIVSLSRPLLFTGLTTRPDLLCAVAGWLSIIAAWQMLRTAPANSGRWALTSGALSGLAGLFHPFALVFAMQGGVAMLLGTATVMQKTKRAALYLAGNVLAISLWIPLIVSYPYEFRSQFFANVLDRAGPGLPARIVWPIPSLIHHAKLLSEFAGPLQCLLMASGLVLGSVFLWQQRGITASERKGLIALVWSSVFLTATVAGLHPTKGYWIYPFVWIVAIAVVGIDDFISKRMVDAGLMPANGRASAVRGLLLAIAILMLLPGAGLRTTWVYLSRWKDPSVYAPAFIEGVLNDLPREGVFYADLSYVFDVYLSGRETRLCQEREQYWGDEPISYTYLLLSWEGEDAGWANQYDGLHVRRFGTREIPQNCFVDLYRPAPVHHAEPHDSLPPDGDSK